MSLLYIIAIIFVIVTLYKNNEKNKKTKIHTSVKYNYSMEQYNEIKDSEKLQPYFSVLENQRDVIDSVDIKRRNISVRICNEEGERYIGTYDVPEGIRDFTETEIFIIKVVSLQILGNNFCEWADLLNPDNFHRKIVLRKDAGNDKIHNKDTTPNRPY